MNIRKVRETNKLIFIAMEMTTAKTVAVFAIIVGCFLVLYPKIFHPMILHLFGMAPAKRTDDSTLTRLPPHLRHAMASGKRGSGRDDASAQARAGAHPGLRASAEMRKTAQQSTTGGDKGMMGVVLPMYAVGIVLYLIYTLTKVFGRKDKSDSSAAGGGNGDYLSNHFADVRNAAAAEHKSAQKQKELEKLLMKAENEDINDTEMNELKRRLVETEAQMSRILQAMEAVQQKVTATTATVGASLNGLVDGEQSENANFVEDIGPIQHEDTDAVDQVAVDEDYHDDQSGSSGDEIEASDPDEEDVDENRADTRLPQSQPVDKVRHRVVRVAAPSGRSRNIVGIANEFGKFPANNVDSSAAETSIVNDIRPQVAVKKTD